MLGFLLKKQLSESFRAVFYDAKRNRMRPKWAIVLWVLLYCGLMVGVLGGSFTSLALGICGPLTEAGAGWLYYLLLGGIALLLGVIGGAFNAYAGIYLARDNELLLSLPIPVKTILAARMLTVYFLGALCLSVALLPALIVGWVVAGATAARVLGGLVLLCVSTLLVLILSCLLGWVIARCSLRLKNKSFVTVLIAVAFLGGYYFFYFRAQILLQDMIANAALYAAQIRGGAAVLYGFGRIGEGDWKSAAVFLLVTLALFLAMWLILRRSFLRIVTGSPKTAGARYTEKAVRAKSPFAALLGKELRRFTASPNYMLNCGLGILLLPAAGIGLLLKGRELYPTLTELLPGGGGTLPVLLCAMLCLLSSMNNMAAPSVSLEGKSLWLLQSLPVPASTVLRAKLTMQLLLTEPPMLFAALCAALSLREALPLRLLLLVTPMVYAVFSAVFCTALGVGMPILSWTRELVPIKQSGAVAIAVFGSWGVMILMGVLYLALGETIGATAYLLAWTVLLALAALLGLRWLDTKGAAIFARL